MRVSDWILSLNDACGVLCCPDLCNGRSTIPPATSAAPETVNASGKPAKVTQAGANVRHTALLVWIWSLGVAGDIVAGIVTWIVVGNIAGTVAGIDVGIAGGLWLCAGQIR